MNTSLVHDPAGEPLDWSHFVARSGDEGRRWVEQYRRPELVQLARWSSESLRLLRRRNLEAGREVLERIDARLQTMNGSAPPSVARVLERWYYSVLAYHRYCVEDFDGAEHALGQAHEAVRAGIEMHRFLLPLATHCSDFAIQRARVARNRRRWREMRAGVELVRSMMAGGAPFCTLRDGTPVRLAEVLGFYDSLPGLTDAERESLRSLLDERVRRDDLDRFIAGLYAVPGMIIPYP
jgi:hypothetical protein